MSPEILAPAGGMPQLEAAVRSGADAVYLGASTMNARRSAANFDDEQLAEAVRYCHIRGVKVYLTMNTLLLDSELAEADKLLRLACRLHIDGVIVQDIGLASYIAAHAPQLRLHASTQTSVHTPSGLRLLGRLGFCRAVLARELSRGELRELADGSPVELEYFVHGALCMSVSGQCLLSAMLGQRSGNRGRCAQPCRLPFRDGQFMNCLSLKDSCLIPDIGELADIGVCSLKIEGRMKRPEYCAAVTDACVRARDGGGREDDIPRLAAIFSRSGFTDGYYRGFETYARRCGRRDMFGVRTKDDVTAADNATLASIHTLYKNERQSVPVEMIIADTADGVKLAVSDGDGNSAEICEQLPVNESAQSALSPSVEKKLTKTGGTPYTVKKLEVDGEGIAHALTPSAAGELRRQALDKLTEMRGSAEPIPVGESDIEAVMPHSKRYESRFDMTFRSLAQIPERFPKNAILPYGRAYLPLEMPTEQYMRAAERLAKAGFETAVECPRGMLGRESRIAELLAEKRKLGAETCMAHNLGAIELIQNAGMKCFGGFGLNVTNTLSLRTLEQLGLSGAELSFELTLAQIAALGADIPRAVMIYGYQPLMLTRCCPASLENGCRGLSKERDAGRSNGGVCRITDRMGKDFAVMCREGCSEIFNTVPVCIVDSLPQTGGTEHFIARFTVENPAETADIIERITRGVIAGNRLGVTRGLYARGVL